MLKLILLGVILTLLAGVILRRFIGFSAQRPSDYADLGNPFDIREQLNGEMLCEGVIYGPMGRVNTRFVATMNAVWDGDKGTMTEDFTYDTGGTLARKWTLEVTADGQIKATAPDIIGTGLGQQMGNSVCLNYKIKLPDDAGGHVLSTTDWMYLMANGTIMNRSQMRKFGLKVGELVATIRKMP